MKELIIDILSNEIDKNIVADLINSYSDVKDAFIKGDYEGAQSKSGKFVENVFRTLYHIRRKKVLPEIKQHQIEEITKDLLNSDGKTYPESIRILIPSIAKSMIYEPRSKLGSVHQKPIKPDFIDAKLTVGASDWIIAELLRLYHTRDAQKVNELIKNVVKDYIPVLQKVGDETFVDAKTNCEEEILIRLSDVGNGGLSRKELGKSMKHNFDRSTITNTLGKLIKNKDIFFTKDNKYVIFESSRKKIANKIIKLQEE